MTSEDSSKTQFFVIQEESDENIKDPRETPQAFSLYNALQNSYVYFDASPHGLLVSNNLPEAILQYPQLPSGCEPASLTWALQSLGFQVTVDDIIDEHLEYGDDIVNQYSGDLYSSGGALPPAIVAAANSFLQSENSELEAYDLTGCSFEELGLVVEGGYPVLVWTTMYSEEPWYTDTYLEGGYRWYDNEHCAVLYGIEDEQALIMDPLEGFITQNIAEYKNLYEACGSMSVIIS